MIWTDFSESMLPLLWNATWQSAVLAVLVYLILRLLGAWMVPAWRVWLIAIPLVRLMMLVLPASDFSLYQWVAEPVETPAIQVHLESTPLPLSKPAAQDQPFFPDAWESSTITPRPPQPVRPQPNWTATGSLTSAAIAVWLLVSVGLAIRSVYARIVLRRIVSAGSPITDERLQAVLDRCCRQAGLRRRVRCVLTDADIGPSTCGILFPHILISKTMVSELTDQEWSMVVAHEVEHIRRYDSLLALLGELAVILHWYNPLTYLLRRRLRREIEVAVDAATLGRLGGSLVKSYAELLIRLADRTRLQFGMVQMAGCRSGLGRRIESLVKRKQPQRWQFVLSAVIAALVALTGLSEVEPKLAVAQQAGASAQAPDAPTGTTSQSAAATDNDAQDTTDASASPAEPPAAMPKADRASKGWPRASGRVVDASGSPVAGTLLTSDVWMAVGDRRSVSATTDANGEFSIAYPPGTRHFEMYHTWFYAEGHGVRVVMMGRLFQNEQGKRDTVEGVEIVLPPEEAVEFQVQLPDGDPCVHANVRPHYFDVPNGTFAADEPTGLTSPLPEALADKFTTAPDEQGRVRISAIPKALFASVMVETPEYGRQFFENIDQSLRLAEVGTIEGVVRIEAPERFAGTSVIMTTHSTDPQSIWWQQGYAQVELNERGRFRIPAMVAGRIEMFFINWDPQLEFQPVFKGPRDLKAGQTLDVIVEARPATLVTGRVVTPDTGEPVAGGQIHYRHFQGVRTSGAVFTDEDGRYAVRVPAGKVRRQLISLGPLLSDVRYSHPSLKPIEIPDGVDTFDAGTIEIGMKDLVTGILRNAAGQPAPGKTVVLHRGVRRFLLGKAKTDANGQFKIWVRSWGNVRVGENRYWATLDREAIGAEPPQFTKLHVIDDNPDALVLQQP